MSTHQNSEDKLREKLQSFEFGPMPSAWEQMNTLLDQNTPVTGHPKSDSTPASRPASWRWLRILLPALFIFGTAAFIYSVTINAAPGETTPAKDYEEFVPQTPSANHQPRAGDSGSPPTATLESTVQPNTSTKKADYRPKSTLSNTQASTNESILKKISTSNSESGSIEGAKTKLPSSELDESLPISETNLNGEEPIIDEATLYPGTNIQPLAATNERMSVLSPLATKEQTPSFEQEIPSISYSSFTTPTGVGRPFQFGVLIGSGIALSGLYQQGNKSTSHLGFFSNYRINARNRLQVEANIKYGANYNLSTTFTNFQSTPVGFQVSQIELTTSELLFVEFPVFWKYQMGKGYLLGGARTSIVYLPGNGQRNSYTLSGESFTEVDNNRSGIRKMDMGALVGYEWLFSSRMSLDVRYVQGLFDLTADNWFKNESTLLNSDLQLSIRYFF